MKYLIVSILFVFSANTFADENIRSLRSIFHIDDGMYVSSGRANNHSKNEKLLQKLWHSKKQILFQDKFKQDWKKASNQDLLFNPGAEVNHFVLFSKNRVSNIKVNGASLFKWGCDDSIIPVLNLEKWPFKDKPWEWEGVVIEIGKYQGLPELVTINNNFLALIPENEKRLILTEDNPAIELKWKGTSHLRIILVDFETDGGSTNKELIIINKLTNKIEILKSKSPFDSRC